MVNAQEYINEKYPIDNVCQRKSDQENKDKKREEVIILDISKGKVGKHWYKTGEGNKNLTGSLKLEGFTKLRKLIVSSHQLTELDVSECENLRELDCSSNELDNLNVSGCSNLKIINCSNNNLEELNLSFCSRLEEVNINNCPELVSGRIKTNLYYDVDNGKLVKDNSQKETKASSRIKKVEDNDIRNILIVGITGNGKSTLTNVLTDTTQFVEKSSSTSVTKNFQTSDIFEWESKKYRVIDNIGFSDTNNISKEDILFKIGEGIHEAKEGINQILFVFKDRFSEDQVIAFNLFKDFIAETGITKFTTIVKTGFENFRNKQRCEEDKQILLNQAKGLSEIINSCNGIVYVNNPAIPAIKESEDEETKEANKIIAKTNKKSREKSRKIVLNHLANNCQEIYKLEEWDSIVSMVNKYNERKKEIEQNSSSTKEEELKQAKTELVKKVDESIEASAGVSIPQFPVKFNLSLKREKHIEEYKANTEAPPKK